MTFDGASAVIGVAAVLALIGLAVAIGWRGRPEWWASDRFKTTNADKRWASATVWGLCCAMFTANWVAMISSSFAYRHPSLPPVGAWTCAALIFIGSFFSSLAMEPESPRAHKIFAAGFTFSAIAFFVMLCRG